MSTDQWTDKELIDCWQATKDKSAFQVLDDRHRPRITRYIRRSLHGYFKDFADDIAQVVFLTLQKTAFSFPDAPAVGAWLTMIADQRVDNFVRDQHCAKRDNRRTVEFSRLLVEQTGGNGDGDRSSRENVREEFIRRETPDQLACRNESDELIRKLIDRLADEEKAVLTKMWLEGHDMTSAAEALGISRAKAWRAVERAKEKLRGMYEVRQLADESAEELSP
jgi:RNA polymerase sigma factor (sigma-70 family)